ncbi:MAG TPA: helix-turn-helix transcriptional regulator [Gemmataceae bacterium]|jgi:transcriptional regulator with XRE-family HTH domain
MTTLGERLQQERKRRGWTQVELAGIAGVGLATIRRIEQHTFEPRLDSIRRLAAALEVPAGWLAFDDEAVGEPSRMEGNNDGQ